jgi:hypothetical protein
VAGDCSSPRISRKGWSRRRDETSIPTLCQNTLFRAAN